MSADARTDRPFYRNTRELQSLVPDLCAPAALQAFLSVIRARRARLASPDSALPNQTPPLAP